MKHDQQFRREALARKDLDWSEQSETTTISLTKLSVQPGIHTNGAIGLKGQTSVSGFRLNSSTNYVGSLANWSKLSASLAEFND